MTLQSYPEPIQGSLDNCVGVPSKSIQPLACRLLLAKANPTAMMTARKGNTNLDFFILLHLKIIAYSFVQVFGITPETSRHVIHLYFCFCSRHSPNMAIPVNSILKIRCCFQLSMLMIPPQEHGSSIPEPRRTARYIVKINKVTIAIISAIFFVYFTISSTAIEHSYMGNAHCTPRLKTSLLNSGLLMRSA